MTLRLGSFGAPFGNESRIMETVYDFSADTGAVADYVLTAAADTDLMVKLVAIKSDVAPTSAGAALLTVETTATADADRTKTGTDGSATSES